MKGQVSDVSSGPTGGLPETAFEMINRYGTYEIQATADTENMYPAIAQGFDKRIINKDCENTSAKGDKDDKKQNQSLNETI